MKNSMVYVRIIAVGMVLATGLLATYTYTSSNFITASSNFVTVKINPHTIELLGAARDGDIQGIKQALTFVDINSQNEAGITALMRAAQNSKEEVIAFLLSKKADPTIIDDQGMSALEWALYAHPATSKPIQRRVKRILELLLQAGAPKTKKAYTKAVKFGYPEDITALLEVKQ